MLHLARTVSNSNSKYKSKFIPGLLCGCHFGRLLGQPWDGGPALSRCCSTDLCAAQGSWDPNTAERGHGSSCVLGASSAWCPWKRSCLSPWGHWSAMGAIMRPHRVKSGQLPQGTAELIQRHWRGAAVSLSKQSGCTDQRNGQPPLRGLL